MPTQCNLFVVNCTRSTMTPGWSHIYQMDQWQFASIPPLTQTYFYVQFYSGHYDEDDGADQNYALSESPSTPVINIYATSDNKSVHYLSVQSLGAAVPSNLVVAIVPATTFNAAGADGVSWYPLTGVTTPPPASHTPAQYQIGPVTANLMSMSFAVVDLEVLVGEHEAPVYFQAISSGSLTSGQRTTLYVGVDTMVQFSNLDGLGLAPYWMSATYGALAPLQLSAVCVPGTHDSGMGTMTAATLGSDACNTQTQRLSVLGQLNAGARFFDFRPCVWPDLDGFYLCHYTDTGAFVNATVGIFGAAGQSLASALADVVSFFEQPPTTNELVILRFSHFAWIANPLGIYHWGPMKTTQFQSLVSQVTSALEGSLFTSSDPAVNLNQQTIETLCGKGNRVLALFDLGRGKEGQFPSSLVAPQNGVFGYEDFRPEEKVPIVGSPDFVLYDSFSKTDQAKKMIANQKTKLNGYTPASDRSFLLSWTLTLTVSDVTTRKMCISQLAAEANPLLLPGVDEWIADGTITVDRKPNVLLVDYIGTYGDNAANVAMQLNAFQKPVT